MLLSELSKADRNVHASGLDPQIQGLTADSRNVKPGYLFAALPGYELDGREFITDAISKGAAAILAPQGTILPSEIEEIPLIEVENPRRSLALFSKEFFKIQPRITAAVTGTNGKTSVAWFTQHIWKLMGHQSAAMGTLGTTALKTSQKTKAGLTTADPVTLHYELKDLVDKNINHVVLEASSHGLEQSRLDGVKLTAGAFTNLSQDHLDYHGSMERYRTAKLRLFDSLLTKDATAVLNADSAEFELFSTTCKSRGVNVIEYGRKAKDIRINSVNAKPNGQRISVNLLGKRYELDVRLIGRFQAQNVLCALGLIIACGDEPERAIAILPEIQGPPGRLELVSHTLNGAPVYVDYAHTPDALAAILSALRPHTVGSLSLIFGCGGNRDKTKRPLMGTIANNLADKVYLTDDNPRGESPSKIRAEIKVNCPKAIEISDRSEAIKQAIINLSSEDTLVIAGKGHESGQVIGEKIVPFEDSAVARNVIATIKEREL